MQKTTRWPPKRNRVRIWMYGILFVLVFTVAGYWLYDHIFYPAFKSTEGECFEEEALVLNQTRAAPGESAIAGAFQVSPNGTSKITVLFDFPDRRVLKHEWCHARQYQQGRMFGCELAGTLKMVVESECYVAQRLPDEIYDWVYGKPLSMG